MEEPFTGLFSVLVTRVPSSPPVIHTRAGQSADVFVFPSRTDTFGLVLIEALASGVPVAAFPVPGPLDVIGNSGVGCLDEDLWKAAMTALSVDRARCRDHARQFSWETSARQFLNNLDPFEPERAWHDAEPGVALNGAEA